MVPAPHRRRCRGDHALGSYLTLPIVACCFLFPTTPGATQGGRGEYGPAVLDGGSLGGW
jgi:hypothetical protein